jgi:hypothetical protein
VGRRSEKLLARGRVGVSCCVVSLVFFAIRFPFAAQSSSCGELRRLSYLYFFVPFFILSGGVFIIGLGFGRITLLEGVRLEGRILLWKKTVRVADVEGV